MSDEPLSRSRPKRKSAAATAEKIQASLKEESKRVTEETVAADAPAPKKAKSEGKTTKTRKNLCCSTNIIELYQSMPR